MKVFFYNNFMKTVFTILVVFTFGCTEVIDVELNSTNPKIVIEGSITEIIGQVEKNSIATVRISKTMDYFNSKDFPKVTNAIVEISDNKGNTKSLREVSPGLYKLSGINYNYYDTITLKVDIVNNNYSAKSEFVKPLELDSISYSINENNDEEYDVITIFFQDNPNKEDFAQAKIYVNGKQLYLTYFELYSDQYVNGRYIDSEIKILRDSTLVDRSGFKKGDKVEIELITFNKSAYLYYDVLNDLVDNNGEDFDFGGKRIPDNPPTNLSNDALGYFGAYSVSRKSIVIK